MDTTSIAEAVYCYKMSRPDSYRKDKHTAQRYEVCLYELLNQMDSEEKKLYETLASLVCENARDHVDNFVKIATLLKFESEDDFYYLQIIQRKKEHPELGSNSRVIKTYYIRSKDYLISKYDEITSQCKIFDARAYINLNRRSLERMAFHTLKKVTDQIMNKDFMSIHKAYESVCGSYSSESHKKWIIDIDWKDWEGKQLPASELINTLKSLQSEASNEPITEIIPTKNGIHIITHAFNLQIFREKFPEIDVHKDNPTLLFSNGITKAIDN